MFSLLFSFDLVFLWLVVGCYPRLRIGLGCCLIAVAIDEVVVIRHSLWTGRDGAKANEGKTPLVGGMLAFGIVKVCAALATHIGFVSQCPVIVYHVGITDIM